MRTFFIFGLTFVVSAVAQVPEWQQCGGINYNGPTNCVAGTTCQVINNWYFQCLLGQSTPPPPSPPPPGSGSVVPSLVGGENVMGDGTYPRATRLADGSILSVRTTFSNGVNIIVTQSSHDNGITWQNLGEVTRGVGNIDNPFVIQLANGRVLCAFRNHSVNSAGQITYFRITVCYSDDGGKTWGYLSTPDQNGNPVTGLWEPFMRLAKDGSLQLYYSRENAGNDQDSIMRTSNDGGQSWSGDMTISGAGITGRDGMIGVAPFNDGTDKLIAVFETTEDGPFCIKAVTSSDDGRTWGNRQLVYRAPGSNDSNAPQVTNAGGTLVVTFMTTEDGGGPALKLLVQTGETSGTISWGNKITVAPASTYWGGLMTLDNLNVLSLFDHGGSKSQVVNLAASRPACKRTRSRK